MKAIMHDLILSQRELLLDSLDVRFMHIDCDRLDRTTMLERKSLKKASQTLLFAIIRDILNRRFFDVADNRHVAMTFRERLLVSANASNTTGLLPSFPASYRSLDQPPALIPTDSKDFVRRRYHFAGRQHLDRMTFKKQSEPRTRLGPGGSHLPYPMLRALQSGKTST